jgi:hypothetical protein
MSRRLGDSADGSFVVPGGEEWDADNVLVVPSEGDVDDFLVAHNEEESVPVVPSEGESFPVVPSREEDDPIESPAKRFRVDTSSPEDFASARLFSVVSREHPFAKRINTEIKELIEIGYRCLDSYGVGEDFVAHICCPIGDKDSIFRTSALKRMKQHSDDSVGLVLTIVFKREYPFVPLVVSVSQYIPYDLQYDAGVKDQAGIDAQTGVVCADILHSVAWSPACTLRVILEAIQLSVCEIVCLSDMKGVDKDQLALGLDDIATILGQHKDYESAHNGRGYSK